MLSASSSSATVRVEKATSDLLINPDWTMNIDICDYINSNPGQAKDVLKAVKKRLQHRSPRVQFLALTLLEAMVNNCGDYIHFQIAEKNILEEMVKIVKKKTDMNVRDKTLSLLDTWQEGSGGQGGKYPQYYFAYDELRRAGVAFPRRSSPVAPMFTPPVAHPVIAHDREGYAMPNIPLRRLGEAMAAEKDTLSASTLDSMKNITELLSDMLQAVNPGDTEAVKDEVVSDLVDRCRANQKKLMQMLTTTDDEKLLGLGLELHDFMQNLLAKHDAIASGSAFLSHATDIASTFTVSSQPTTLSPPVDEKSSQPGEFKQNIGPRPSICPQSPAAIATFPRAFIDEEEEEDDDFALLARRHSRSPASHATFAANGTSSASEEAGSRIGTSTSETPLTATSKALVLTDPTPPVKTPAKEQDMIDLLSLAITTTSVSPEDPPSITSSTSPYLNTQNLPVLPNGHANPYSSEMNFNDPRQDAFSGFVAPWAQPRPQPQSMAQPQYPSYSYPPPPWASSSSTLAHQPMSGSSSSGFSAAHSVTHTSIESATTTTPRFSPVTVSNQTSLNAALAGQGALSSTSQKPYVPSYRLFEDLNVLPKGEGANGVSSSSLSGISGQSRIGGWR